MFNDKNEPPCDVGDVLTFKYDNLQKFLSFLHHSDIQMTNKIKNLNLKISEIDHLKTRLQEAEFKLNLSQNKIIELDQTQNAHQLKLIDLDLRSISSENKIIQTEKNLNIIQNKINEIEDNVNSLNRVSEDNINTIRKINDANGEIKVQQDRFIIEIEKIKNESKETKESFDRKCKEIELSSEKKFVVMNENLSVMNKKIQSTEDSLGKVVEMTNRVKENVSHNEVNRNFSRKNTVSGISPTTINNIQREIISNENLNTNSVINEINKIFSQLDWLKNENRERKESIENIAKTAEEFRENFIQNFKRENSSSKSNQQLDQESVRKEKSFEYKNSVQSIEQQFKLMNTEEDELTSENIRKAKENFKLIDHNTNKGIHQEDLDRLNKLFKLEIEKLNEKFNNQMKIIDGKLKQINFTKFENINSTDLKLDKNFLTQIGELIERKTKDILDKEILNVNNRQNIERKNSNDKIDICKIDIDKVYESLMDLRKSFLQSRKPFEDMIKESNTKISELEDTIRNQRLKIDDIIRNIEGELYDSTTFNFEEFKNSHGKNSIRDLIKNLNTNSKNLSEKVDQIQAKQNNLNNVILTKVKKDLHNESGRILDDFKLDLRNSINKIQEQLKEKVDLINLDEFGKKIDNRVLIEISKKLDKNDLRKNTHIINKKIDNLENKISKTLVDTLFDMQLDEAPLIVKKSVNGEKCASCNQELTNNNEILMSHNNLDHINLTKSMNNKKRHRVMNKTLNEDACENSKTVRISELPEINATMSKTKSQFNFVHRK